MKEKERKEETLKKNLKAITKNSKNKNIKKTFKKKKKKGARPNPRIAATAPPQALFSSFSSPDTEKQKHQRQKTQEEGPKARE